jgi:hypothetical protein
LKCFHAPTGIEHDRAHRAAFARFLAAANVAAMMVLALVEAQPTQLVIPVPAPAALSLA